MEAACNSCLTFALKLITYPSLELCEILYKMDYDSTCKLYKKCYFMSVITCAVTVQNFEVISYTFKIDKLGTKVIMYLQK